MGVIYGLGGKALGPATKHHPDPKIFGGMKAMPYAEFEAKP